MTKILYFTAGPVPTSDEKTDIEALNTLTGVKYEVGVRNRLVSTNFGAGVEQCDMVAGTPPSGEPWASKPVFNPDDAGEGFAPVYNGMTLEGVEPTGTYTDTVTFEVTDGVITGITLS